MVTCTMFIKRVETLHVWIADGAQAEARAAKAENEAGGWAKVRRVEGIGYWGGPKP